MRLALLDDSAFPGTRTRPQTAPSTFKPVRILPGAGAGVKRPPLYGLCSSFTGM